MDACKAEEAIYQLAITYFEGLRSALIKELNHESDEDKITAIDRKLDAVGDMLDAYKKVREAFK